jgi:predicted ester cyclase
MSWCLRCRSFVGWIAHSDRYNLPRMDEPAMDFDGVTLSPQKELVRVFYKELWDRADKSLIPRIFHPDFTFRGSLGPTLIGHEQFAGYVDWVTDAFGQYTTDILVMVEEGNRVMGKTRFHGIHRKEMFGVPPTGRHVWWTGMPIFIFENSRVRDLFVLGDIHGLIGRLKE